MVEPIPGNVGGYQDREPAEAVCHTISDRVRRVTADRRVNMTLARDLHTRLDYVANVDDPSGLTRLDDVDLNFDNARVVETAGAEPLEVNRESSVRVASRPACTDALHRKGSQFELHHRGALSPASSVKSVGDVTGVWIASRAHSTMRRRSAASPVGPSPGSPQTCSIFTPLTTRLPPA